MKIFFSKSDSTNWSYKMFTKSERIHDAISSQGIFFLPDGCKENFLRSTEITVNGNNTVVKKLNLFNSKIQKSVFTLFGATKTQISNGIN